MFPLSDVVFPYMLLPLHIFEERYRTMMKDLRAGDGHFGVVLIARGSEIGGGDQRNHTGTLVRLLDSEELDDGRWVAVTAGTNRIRVERWLEDDPYPRAEVEVIEDPPAGEDADKQRLEVQRLVRKVAAMQAELGVPGPPVDFELSVNPLIASYQACAVSPISAFDGQRLLEIDPPEARLRHLADLLGEHVTTLGLQLAEGG